MFSCLSSRPQNEYKRVASDDEDDVPPSSNSSSSSTQRSFLLRPFFLDLLPLLYAGSKRSLTLDDLSAIPPHVLAAPARQKLEEALAKEDQSSAPLLRAGTRALASDLAAPFFPRLVLLLATFGQVWLVQGLTRFVSDPSIPKDQGWTLVFGFATVYISITLSTFYYWEKVFELATISRAALVSTIFSKTLRLNSAAAREVGQGAATTYMSIDSERVSDSLEYLHEMWAAALSLVIACVLLWLEARWSAVTPLLIIILSLSCTSALSVSVASTQTSWMASIDQRIRLLSSVFHHLLPIKLGAYERPLMEKIGDLRVKETDALQRFYWLLIITSTIAKLGSALAGPACLATYAIILRFDPSAAPLDLPKIFTILTIVSLLNYPVTIIIQTLPELVAGYASLKRIQSFLVLPEKVASPPRPSDALSTVVKVDIKGGSFGWDDETAVLKDIDLQLTPGELHIVVGPVASGKSTLLMTILGESVKLKGSIDVQARKIVLATQSPFIFPGTFRANVLLDGPYEKETFDRVINACGLRHDLDKLPKGEHSMLGERGVSLSGGQRQRLSLARAVYADADLILLDDTFSALDGETETHVFASLFGPTGLLKGKTTVLVTHGLQHLSSANEVILMESGRITHVGSFQENRLAGAEIALGSKVGTWEKSTEEEDTKPEPAVVEESDEEEDEEMKGDKLGGALWIGYGLVLQATGIWRSSLCISLILVLAAARVAVQLYIKQFASSHGNLGRWISGYAGISAATAIIYFFTLGFYTYSLTHKAGRVIHQQQLESIMRSPLSFIQSVSSGKVLNRFSQDIQLSDFGFPLGAFNLSLGVLALIAAMAFFVSATPYLGISFLVLGPAYCYLTRFYLATSEQLQHLESGSKSPLYTLFSTTLSGLYTIRAFHADEFFRLKQDERLNLSQRPFVFRCTGQLFLQVSLSWMTTFLAVGLAALAVQHRESTSAALLGVALFQLLGLGEALMGTLMTYARVENCVVSLERINEFIELSPEEDGSLTNVQLDQGPDLWPNKGRIEFVEYSMRYKEDLPPALNSVSFSFPGGRKIGICGRTGSGKSSTLLALFRAIDSHLVTGKILIDGVDTSSISLERLRDSMSIVTQDPFLWHGSIRENLDVEGQCSDEAIWKALRTVGMDEVVSLLPEKLESLVVVEESFSKGQSQLLCLARALLRKKKIVVLDESTSSMDHLTDEKIRQVVDSELAGSTVLAIAHRISSIINFDRILLLENGSVLEFDTPQNLLSNPSSRFTRLAATQGIFGVDEPST